jgi:hypothetical protein
MVTIDQIDFSKLKPYDGKATKCFEQLCYQIAQREFGHLGSFTPIDGSGGDGGVEFYLNLTNGEKWGWQCKFFGDTGRLSVGNRKTQIADSFETACRNHLGLNKWILCLKTDLTENSTAPDGTISKGEQDWFRNLLPNKIPAGRSVVLEHWGESKFLSLLNSPNQIGIRSFFFGELEFSNEWFKKRFDENFEKVRDKYDPDLHSIDKYTQSKIDFLLFDSNYCKHIELLQKELLEKSNQIEVALKDFRDEKMISEKEVVQRENYLLFCNEFKNHIAYVFERIEFVSNCFKNYSEDLLLNFDIKKVRENFFEHFNKIDYTVFEEKSRVFKDASSISYLISEFGNIYNQFFRNYFHEKQKELHFLADAAKGKTHISCDIVYRKVKEDKPGIFITGDKFTDETNLTGALKQILDINQEFTLDEFVQALDIYGEIVKCKIPIVIDGLNETTFNRLFSPIWKNHLGSFISKISQSKNLVIVTTCRSSYKKRIWNETTDKRFNLLYGFEDYETILEAVNKYFKKYKLKADLFFAPLEKFGDPIFLKIFCEIKNYNRKASDEVQVNIEEESTYDVFNEYLNQVNKRVTQNNHLLKTGEQFISESLSILSNHLWKNNLREIPLTDFYSLIDGNKPHEKDRSKAEILINEGLVVTRDMRGQQEYVSFTYDILAGYIISENLIHSNQNLQYFTSIEFIEKIIQDTGQHPFFEDVISSLCLLLPQLKQFSFHELIDRDKKIKFTRSKLFKHLPQIITKQFSKRISFANSAFGKSIVSLYKLPAQYVKSEDRNLVENLFFGSHQNQKIFFDLSFKTLGDIKHPLNALFISKVLESMPMNQRDISWTEYIRKKSHDLESFISEFEVQCKNINEESVIVIQKQHVLSKIILWFLTSTNRALRDDATRALYYYGRKFPNQFSSLVYDSLKINDPYVWERTLAALYGVTMAEHNSFKSDKFRNILLPEICKSIYNLIFKETALFSTTHILARDYARRTIEICLLHNPTSLTQDEIKNVRPPYSHGGIRDLGEHDYGENDYDYSGPIQMDFSNYTLGHIVKDGSSYSNPPEKIKVRRQIYWRIYDLGWNAELFKEAETALGNDNYYNRGRTERAKIERYGKKYSWIAYFENAGLRDDLGLMDRDWDRFRISGADIDPSFPSKPKGELFIKDDLLGDRATPLVDWYENGGMPFIEDYLSMKDVAGNNGEWICLDAYASQEDVPAERHRFTFIRSFLIKEEEYLEVIDLLKKQNLGGRWLPEKHENYYSYAGELYYCNDSTSSNYTTFEFITAKKKIKIKKGEPGYYPSVFWDTEGDEIGLRKEFPDEIEMEVSETKEFEVLMPVMEYNWEGYHSHLNDAGNSTIVAKEVANHLKLVNQAQTFDLFESNGDKASFNIYYHDDYNNNHSFVYLRKDLLDKYLSEKKLKFIWAIWGEREVTFKTNERRHEFFTAHPFKEHQVFQKVIEYVI